MRVDIEVNEACGSCASRKACAMGSSQKREITICTDESASYSVGETVNIGARQSLGVMAVILCYVVPLLVLIVALIVANILGCSDALSAVAGLVATAIYYAVLALLRKHISKKVTFTINKI